MKEGGKAEEVVIVVRRRKFEEEDAKVWRKFVNVGREERSCCMSVEGADLEEVLIVRLRGSTLNVCKRTCKCLS